MPEKKLLIVVDYQKDFVSGSLGFPEAVALEDAICEKICSYKANGGEVVYTLDTHYHDYLKTYEGRHLPIVHCLWESDGWQLYGKVKNLLAEDTYFEKNTFGSIELMNYLEENEFDSVELVGVVTNICVISNAVLAKAAYPESEIIIDAACVAGNDKELHQKALDVMESLQMKVINRK